MIKALNTVLSGHGTITKLNATSKIKPQWSKIKRWPPNVKENGSSVSAGIRLKCDEAVGFFVVCFSRYWYMSYREDDSPFLADLILACNLWWFRKQLLVSKGRLFS